MLKTLSEDHLPTKGEQMLPCCGFFMNPNETLDEVEVIGVIMELIGLFCMKMKWSSL